MVTESEYEQFRNAGYFVRESFLAPDVCEAFVKRLDERYLLNPGSKRLLPDRVFESLIVDECILTIVHRLLGPDVRFHHANGRVQRDHGIEKPWHHDYDGELQGGAVADSMVHIMIYPVGLTHATGPLLVLPGSHRKGVERSHPNQFGDALLEGAEKIVCGPGTIVVLCSALWHARAKPVTLPRYDVNLSYCTPDPTRQERLEWGEVHRAIAARSAASHRYLFHQDVC
jgi:ectoine hydroxylase-related dioxygenase (phytanoyl-CoA dioxygenase family)